jgi:DNA ligase-1
LDGELIVGSPTAPDVFRSSTSGVMSQDGQPDFTYYVFDHFQYPLNSFRHRYRSISVPLSSGHLRVLEQRPVDTPEAVLEQEACSISLGYEGGILRNPYSQYKFGRSTLREEIMLKVKRYQDAEGVICGFEEQLHNTNEATINELGHTTRSSHKANMLGKDTLGAITVTCELFPGVEFNIGTGFDDFLRKELWAKRGELIGKTVKFKYFGVGMKDRPRFPVFLGFRAKGDISIE